MIEHLWYCAVLFAVDPVKMPIAFASVIAAIAVFLFLRKNTAQIKWKILGIYSHLSLLIFPIIFFALTMHCGADCNTPLTNMVLYSLPLTVLFAGFAGFVAIPAFFLRAGSEIKSGFISEFVGKQSKKLNIGAPKVYFARTFKPIAFSFRSVFSAIFISKSLAQMLIKKEIEAVLLHELAHISSKSSALKVSAFLMNFSPLSIFKSFGNDLSLEEKKADEFVIKTQKTEKYLLSAKRKIEKMK